MDFADQVAVVTSGVDAVGTAIVQMLVERGAKVVFADGDNKQLAQAVIERCAACAGEAMAFEAQVHDQTAAEALIGVAMERWGRLDVLVHNTQVVGNGSVQTVTVEDWQTTLDTNLYGVYHAAKAALKPMMKQRYGRIVFVTGLQGLAGSYNQAPFAAAAGGVLGLMRSLAREVAPWSITVNAVVTGLIHTEMLAQLPPQVQQMGVEIAAQRRIGTPEEAAYPVLCLASGGASFITGQSLAVDGGWTMA